MEDMPWHDAIKKVLEEKGTAMHYKEIAEEIVSQGLRSSAGAKPANFVSVSADASLKKDGDNSPFRRVARGEYVLWENPSNATPPTKTTGTHESEKFDKEKIQNLSNFARKFSSMNSSGGCD